MLYFGGREIGERVGGGGGAVCINANHFLFQKAKYIHVSLSYSTGSE